MSKKQIEAINAVMTELSDISKEEYEKYILCLNGTMTKELIEKVLKNVRLRGFIDSEDLTYKAEQCAISLEEFQDVFHCSEEVTKPTLINETPFESYSARFSYKNKSSHLEVIQGQSSIQILTHIVSESDYFVIDKIDTELKFFKRIKE